MDYTNEKIQSIEKTKKKEDMALIVAAKILATATNLQQQHTNQNIQGIILLNFQRLIF